MELIVAGGYQVSDKRDLKFIVHGNVEDKVWSIGYFPDDFFIVRIEVFVGWLG
jgi:hypothetical protein